MSTILAVLGFGLVAIIILFVFGMIKLQSVLDERVCLSTHTTDEKAKIVISFKQINELLADFRGRRNEFWNSLGQFTIIIAIITLLVLLLIMDKISPEAALPIISGLGSFGLGKTVASVKNNTTPENPSHETPKRDQE